MDRVKKKRKTGEAGDSAQEEELRKDRFDGAAEEAEAVRKAQRGRKKYSHPIYEGEPSPIHMLLRRTLDAANEWEDSMHEKYMEGQVDEMRGKILSCMDAGKEFPPNSEKYHKWTEEMMEDARAGLSKYKECFETSDKYPLHGAEQIRDVDTSEWIILDYSRDKNWTRDTNEERKKWTEEVMENARAGKYPLHGVEQIWDSDTSEWIILDRSRVKNWTRDINRGRKKNKKP